MHAGFQFVFSNFLPQKFAGSASISCIRRHLQRPGIGYAIAKADPGFFNSPMTGCVAVATPDLGRHAARAESNQQLMKRAVMLACDSVECDVQMRLSQLTNRVNQRPINTWSEAAPSEYASSIRKPST
jgi:hypothetical protein